MTGSTLKLIAIVTMFIDHLGVVFFPDLFILRIIGRVAFPIFALAAAEGARYTHDRRGYIARLLLWGLLSEIPFDLMGSNALFSMDGQNVCFTLAAGVACIYLLERHTLWDLAGVAGLLLLTFALSTDYSFVGVLAVVIIHRYAVQGKTVKGVALACIFMAFFFESQIFALLALVPVALYNGKRGVGLKYLFYLFYPLHMLVLWGVWTIVRLNPMAG